MGIDSTPHLVEHATAVACYGYILIHERRAHITITVPSHPEVEGQCSGVARTDDVLSGMTVGIATVHPPAGVVVFASFINHLTDVRPLTTLVAGTPEEHRRLVSVTQHHTANTFTVHRYKTLVA